MRVNNCGARVPVAKDVLDDPKVHPPFQKMGSIRMAQRMNGNIFSDTALTDHGLEGLLQGGIGKGLGSTPGREEPWARPPV